MEFSLPMGSAPTLLTDTEAELMLGLAVEAREKLVESAEEVAAWARLNLESMESNSDCPSDIISMLAMSSVSGMLITLLVVESASSPMYLCLEESEGPEVSIWSVSEVGLGDLLILLGCGEVQVELASSDSPTVGVLPPPELALELVAVPEDSFTSHASSDAAALAARTLW